MKVKKREVYTLWFAGNYEKWYIKDVRGKYLIMKGLEFPWCNDQMTEEKLFGDYKQGAKIGDLKGIWPFRWIKRTDNVDL